MLGQQKDNRLLQNKEIYDKVALKPHHFN